MRKQKKKLNLNDKERQHETDHQDKIFHRQDRQACLHRRKIRLDRPACGRAGGIEKGEFKLIPLGVALALPKGYEAHVVPRSSTFKTYGVIQANSMGIIDNSYCGPNDQWKFPALAVRDTVIEVNDRICQFRHYGESAGTGL